MFSLHYPISQLARKSRPNFILNWCNFTNPSASSNYFGVP